MVDIHTGDLEGSEPLIDYTLGMGQASFTVGQISGFLFTRLFNKLNKEDLQVHLTKLEAQLKSIPNWLSVIYIQSEILKVRSRLAEFNLLEDN